MRHKRWLLLVAVVATLLFLFFMFFFGVAYVRFPYVIFAVVMIPTLLLLLKRNGSKTGMRR